MLGESMASCHIRVPVSSKPKYRSVSRFSSTDSRSKNRTNTCAGTAVRSAKDSISTAPRGIHGHILAVRWRNTPAALFYRGSLHFAMHPRPALGMAGVRLFAAKIRGGDFHSAAHLVESGAHAGSDALLQRIFARRQNQLAVRKPGRLAFGSRAIEIICRDNRGAVFIVSGVQHDPDDIAHPVRRLARSKIIQNQNLHRANRFENLHFRGFIGRVVARLDLLQQFAVVAKQSRMPALNQLLQRGNPKMCFSDARRSYEQQSFFGRARIVANKSLGEQFRLFQRLRVLRHPRFSIREVRDIAFKIAMLVALRNPRAFPHSRRAIQHPAIASYRHSACCAIRTRHKFPTRPSAKRAILQRHSDSIRARNAHGKLSAMGNLWKELQCSFCTIEYCRWNTSFYRTTRGTARTIACRGVLSRVCEAATRDNSCCTTWANSPICRSISISFSRMFKIISIPARFTPMSRASVRITSSRSKSESVYSRVFPCEREGFSKPTRSYSRSVCGCSLYSSATALIM